MHMHLATLTTDYSGFQSSSCPIMQHWDGINLYKQEHNYHQPRSPFSSSYDDTVTSRATNTITVYCLYDWYCFIQLPSMHSYCVCSLCDPSIAPPVLAGLEGRDMTIYYMVTKLEPNMLPIITSSTSQKVYLLFLFYSYIRYSHTSH